MDYIAKDIRRIIAWPPNLRNLSPYWPMSSYVGLVCRGWRLISEPTSQIGGPDPFHVSVRQLSVTQTSSHKAINKDVNFTERLICSDFATLLSYKRVREEGKYIDTVDIPRSSPQHPQIARTAPFIRFCIFCIFTSTTWIAKFQHHDATVPYKSLLSPFAWYLRCY